MKIHQFSIDIDSKKGQGTIFKVQFPLYSPN
jgi:signal transduction histidine kinase